MKGWRRQTQSAQSRGKRSGTNLKGSKALLGAKWFTQQQWEGGNCWQQGDISLQNLVEKSTVSFVMGKHSWDNMRFYCCCYFNNQHILLVFSCIKGDFNINLNRKQFAPEFDNVCSWLVPCGQLSHIVIKVSLQMAHTTDKWCTWLNFILEACKMYCKTFRNKKKIL